MTNPDISLTSFRRNDHSQDGEDGVLDEIFRRLSVTQGWCVEFGAWNGMHLSNTFNLIKNHGWKSVLIEADAAKSVELRANMKPYDGVICLEQFVQLEGQGCLDKVLSRTPIPIDFDLLSIDIDGADYHVWNSVQIYKPKVVIIEYNPSIPDDVSFVQVADIHVRQGSSLRALTELAAAKGYELSCATVCNAIFTRNDLFDRLGLSTNVLETLQRDRSFQSYLFQGFDGSLHIAGCRRLIWHDIEIRESAIQVLPRRLQNYPDTPGNTPLLRRAFFFLWKRFYALRYPSSIR